MNISGVSSLQSPAPLQSLVKQAPADADGDRDGTVRAAPSAAAAANAAQVAAVAGSGKVDVYA